MWLATCTCIPRRPAASSGGPTASCGRRHASPGTSWSTPSCSPKQRIFRTSGVAASRVENCCVPTTDIWAWCRPKVPQPHLGVLVYRTGGLVKKTVTVSIEGYRVFDRSETWHLVCYSSSAPENVFESPLEMSSINHVDIPQDVTFITHSKKSRTVSSDSLGNPYLLHGLAITFSDSLIEPYANIEPSYTSNDSCSPCNHQNQAFIYPQRLHNALTCFSNPESLDPNEFYGSDADLQSYPNSHLFVNEQDANPKTPYCQTNLDPDCETPGLAKMDTEFNPFLTFDTDFTLDSQEFDEIGIPEFPASYFMASF